MWGLDLLGLARFSDTAIKEFPAGWALGAFAETFGDPFPAVKELVQTNMCGLVRMQLLWSDTHTYGNEDVPKAKELAARYEKLAKRFPETPIELSPFCEHNLKNPDPLLSEIQKVAPSCRIVNTPYQGALSKKFKNEVHGTHSKPSGAYNYSFDGTSSVDADVTSYKRRHREAEAFFFWVPQFNGKKNSSDSTPRPERKAWPTSELIESVSYLARKREKVAFPSSGLWKSHADQHNVPPEPRALKPVIIIPQKGPSIEIKVDSGRVIATAPYYGPFAGGGHRYYLGEWGYKVAEKALLIQGSPVVQVCVNNKVIGTVNPAFRAGTFRD